MAPTRRHRLIAIVAVAASVVALVGAGIVRADDAPSLPPVTASQVLASTAQALAGPVVVSGHAETFADLGLPQIPAVLGGESGAIAMVNGTQHLRVWHSDDGVRVAHVLPVAERDLIVNREEAWWWDSTEQRAARISLAELRASLPAGHERLGDGPGAMAAADPIAAADRVIEHLAPHAAISIAGTGRVAGRSVYELALTPTSDRTLIEGVVVAIDPETWLPLRVEIVSRSTGEPAMSAGFTDVSYDEIDPSVFAFEPPPGAEVVDALDEVTSHAAGGRPRRVADAGRPLVFGEGFEARVAIPFDGSIPPELSQVLPYAGPLLSAVVLEGDDGGRWLSVGAMPPSVLEADASRLP